MLVSNNYTMSSFVDRSSKKNWEGGFTKICLFSLFDGCIQKMKTDT